MVERMSKGKRISARQKAIFIDILQHTGNISAAIRAADMSRRGAYGLRKTDRYFAQEWDMALDDALDDLEGALRKRAIEGVEKPVYYGGKMCGSQRNYSDNVGMFILKSRRGETVPKATSASKPLEDENTVVSPRGKLLDRLQEIADRGDKKAPKSEDGSK